MSKLLVFCLLASSALGQVFNPVAKKRTPESIQQLPIEVRQDLAKRRCLIPKYKNVTEDEYGAYTMSHFRSRTSVDYAVVCHIPSLKIQKRPRLLKIKGSMDGRGR